MSKMIYAQEAEFIWAEEGASGSQIMVSSLKNGAWQPSENIISDHNLNILPAIGMNSKKHKLAVWSAVSTTGSVLKYSVNRANAWQPAKVISEQMSTNLAPVVVFDDNDVAWVFWSANNGDDDDIYVARFINGRWTQAQRVNADNSVPDILPEAGQDEQGHVWVTWQQLTSTGYIELSHSFELQSKRRMAKTGAPDVEMIKRMKQRFDSNHGIKPPASFNARSRATLYFPDSKTRPSIPVQGNLN